MGMKPGVADCIICYGERVYGIELKRPKGPDGEPQGYLSAEQKDWRERFIRAGGKYVLCRSLDEVRLALNEWQIPVREKDGL